MSGSYGFSINVDLRPSSAFTFDEVREFIEENGGSNESEILNSTLLEEEKDLIVFFGDNEDPWRYPYYPEVLELLKKIESNYDGFFKGEFQWFEYEVEEDTIQTWTFDGNGGIREEIETISNEDEWDDE
jgi:hypothetical protein